MVTIDGTEITGATIDGDDVSEITVDEEVVWTAIPDSGTYYGFENESADSGLPGGWEAIQSPDGQEVTAADAYAGSQSYRSHFGGSGGGIVRPSVQPYSEYYTDIKAAVWLKQINTSAASDQAGLELREDGDIIAGPRMQNGDLAHYDGSGLVTISTTPNAGEWVRIVVTAVHPDTDTFDVSWQTATDSGSESGLTCPSPITNGWNSFALRTYGASSGHYYDEYEIFSD